MQIFHPNTLVMFLLIFLLWPTFQLGSALWALKIKDSNFHFDSFFFKTHRWENKGLIYERLFLVQKWKKHLPDGGGAFKNGYRKKHLSDFSKPSFEKFLAESCRAEFSHWLAIIPFFVFGFFCPPIVILYMFIYAVLINLPCIIVQRYNRPRIAKLCERLK